MTPSAFDNGAFSDRGWTELEAYLDDRLSVATGLVGVALIEVDRSQQESAAQRLVEHLDPEDHTARTEPQRFVIVRGPLTGPAEMEGLGLRIADSFPSSTSTGSPTERSTVHIGVVTGRRGDAARTLLRHVEFGLEDAKTIGRAMISVGDGPMMADSPQ